MPLGRVVIWSRSVGSRSEGDEGWLETVAYWRRLRRRVEFRRAERERFRGRVRARVLLIIDGWRMEVMTGLRCTGTVDDIERLSSEIFRARWEVRIAAIETAGLTATHVLDHHQGFNQGWKHVSLKSISCALIQCYSTHSLIPSRGGLEVPTHRSRVKINYNLTCTHQEAAGVH